MESNWSRSRCRLEVGVLHLTGREDRRTGAGLPRATRRARAAAARAPPHLPRRARARGPMAGQDRAGTTRVERVAPRFDGTQSRVLEPTRDLELTRFQRCALKPRQHTQALVGRAPLVRALAPRVRGRCPDLSRLRRCAQADRDDHRGTRRAQDPRATSSCPARRRRSHPPERLPSSSSPGSPERE